MAFTLNRLVQSLYGCLIYSLTSFIFSTTLSASDWPEFRGPTRDGISTDVNVPIEWSATDNVVWKQPIPGAGWSSPTLVDGKIYLTTATGSIDDDDISLRALCVDADNGQIVWNVEIVAPSAEIATLGRMENAPVGLRNVRK